MGKSKKQVSKIRKARLRKSKIRSILFRKKINYLVLINAIRSEDERFINILTPRKVNVNAAYETSETPLHVAAQTGNFEIFMKLIDLGANINKRIPKTKETVLHRAILSSSDEIIEYLITNGVNVNVALTESADNPGETALHMAARTGTKKTVRLLLENGANVNAQSKTGVTPLIEAVRGHNKYVNSALMEYGAHKNYTYQENGQIKTIFHAAIESNNFPAICALLNVYDDMDRVFTENNYFYRSISHYILYLALEIDNMDDMIANLLNENIDVNALDSDDELLIDNAVAEFNPDYISIIEKHIVKLIAAEFPVCERNIKAVEGKFDDYLDKCRMEISKIKSRKIEGSNLIFMDVLHKNYHYLALYFKNVDFDKLLVSKSTLLPEYPIYGQMIFYRLVRVERRIDYVKKSEKIIYNIFYELQLPDTFTRELFFHLSNNDLIKISGLSVE